MRPPSTDLEVKIVLPIAHCRGTSWRASLGQEHGRRGRKNEHARKTVHIEPSQVAKSRKAVGPSYGFTRVKLTIQFVSHVFPPSAEKACSHCGASGAVTVHMKRTKIFLPL